MTVTIAAGFLSRAVTSPRRDALVLSGDPERRWGYEELRRGAVAVGHALRAEFGAAPPPEVRIAVLLGSGGEFLEIFHGAALAGIPVMVLDPAWSPAELSSVLRDAPPVRLFCGTATEAVRRCVPDGSVVESSAYEDWLGRYGGRAAADEVAAFADVPDGAPFYVPFTSGSAGRPKGVVRSHRSWLRSFDRTAVEFGIDGTDRVLLPGSLAHSHFLYGAVNALHVGATVHLMPEFDAELALGLLDRHAVTRLYVVPTIVEALLAAARRRPGRSFPGVRSLLSVGAKWSPDRRARAGELFPRADTVEFYGATELSLVSLLHGDGDGPRESVGRPVAGVELSLRGPSGAEVGVNEVGRVYVRSDMLFTGYLSRSDAGAPDRDGWFSVGDMGRLDERGYLHLVGRDGGMLISGGLNVYPEEVEAALLRLEEVAEAAVVGVPDEHWGEVVCAVVRWRDGARLDLAGIRDRTAAHVSRQKCPRRVFEVAGLPHTSSGKVDRVRIRGALLEGAPGVREIA
ncbi:AMP-binding protein [Streptomyces olivoreticuli]|uniref:AMP-binding protein n=1 Tax=Streptomyces olivoreticuli TaxID=68246 RepID=UPI002657C089|nr:AMP-binding protein [Streptomyces olivoreticuli]WKK23712.1 AMP-binding protein [Streptomyces olivoreticuli]